MNHTVKLFLTMIIVAAICAFTVAVHAQSLPPEEAQDESAASYKDEEGRFIYDSAALIGSKRVQPETYVVEVELARPSEQPRPQGGQSEGLRGGASPTVPQMRGRSRGQRRPAPPAAEMMERANRDEMLTRREEELARHREDLSEIERRLDRREREAAEQKRELDGLAEQLAQREHDLALTGQEIEEVILEPLESEEDSNGGSLIAVGSILIALTLWICALIDCLRRSQDDFPARGSNEKLVWVIVLLFTWAIGALLYVFLVRGRPRSTQ